MCRECRYETKYIGLNDEMIAEVRVDTSEYDEYQDYTEEQLKEKIEVEVKKIHMTRGDFIKNIEMTEAMW